MPGLSLDTDIYGKHAPVLSLDTFDVYLVGGCFFLKYNSEMKLPDVRAYLEYRSSRPELDRCPALNDQRRFDHTRLTTEAVNHVLQTNKRFPGRGHSRRAFLVASDMGFGMIRMYQIMTSVSGIAPEESMLVTTSEAQALDWLGCTGTG